MVGHRPSDWHVLDLDKDPTPGDPQRVRTLAKTLHDFADDVSEALRLVKGMAGESTLAEWAGKSAAVFKEEFSGVPKNLKKLEKSYGMCGDALADFWPKLERAQALADRALVKAREARQDLSSAQSKLSSADSWVTRASKEADKYKDDPTGSKTDADKPDEAKVRAATRDVQHAKTAHANAQSAVDSAQSALDAAKKMAEDARKMRDDAAREAKNKIDEASDAGIQNRSWWEDVGDWFSDNWDSIVAVCKVVVAVVGIIAMIIGGPILGAIVLVAALVVLADTLYKYSKGQASLWDVGLAALDCIPGMKGLTTLGGLAKGLKGGMAAVKGIKGGLKGMGLALRGLGKNARSMVADGAKGAYNRVKSVVRSKGSDPVDMATGAMYLPQTDVMLPALLPLSFTRRVASDYRCGWWFGPTWASTIDQRLEVDDAGIAFVTEDGLVLIYPHPGSPDVSVMPQAGPRRPLSRLEAGGYRIEDPLSGHTRYFAHPNADGVALMDRITDRNRHSISFDYDEYGTPLSIRHSGGYHLKLTTDEGRVTALSLAGGAEGGADIVIKRYGYTDGNLTETIGSSGLPLRFTYDERLRITAWTDTNNRSYHYSYDHKDRCVREGGQAGHIAISLEYDVADPAWPDCRITTLTTAEHSISRFVVNGNRQVIAEIDPLGGLVQTEYDAHHHIVARTDELGHRTEFEVNTLGQVLTATRSDGCETWVEYNHLGLPERLVGYDGEVHGWTYDERGNQLSVTYPAGGTARYRYDDTGCLTSVTDAVGDTTAIETDRAGLPVVITAPSGGVTRYERDSFGLPTTITGPDGAETQLVWSVEGKLLRRTDANGTTESWSYDGEGNCIRHVDPTGGTTSFEFTHFDLLAARTGPDGSRYEFDHDSGLRLTRVTGPRGLTWTYHYDAAGNVISETDFDGLTVGYKYDAAGRVTVRENALGQTTLFERNALGRITRKRTADRCTTFAYDRANRLVHAASPGMILTLRRDSAGRVLEEALNGRSLSHQYDLMGRRISRTTPSGAHTSWSHGEDGRVSSMVVAGRTVEFSHDQNGLELTRRISGDLVMESAYDPVGRLASRQLISARSGSVQSRSFGYRADGHVVCIDDQAAGHRRFDLDEVGRVTAVRATGWTERYAYDEVGNQKLAEWPAAHSGEDALGPRSYVGTRVARAGRVRYEYDSLGRVTLRQRTRLSHKPDTWRYEWDAEDRLTMVTTPDGARWGYEYDPLGRRTAKLRLADDGGVIERIDFVWGGSVLCEQTTTSADSHTAITLTWDYKDQRLVAQSESITVANAPQEEIDSRFFAVVTDLVGTPTELLDEEGRVSWRARSSVWGVTAWAVGATAYTPLRFPGQYFDPESGLHYNYFRHYDPETARYVTGDPLGLEPAPNVRGYVANPLTSADPLGLSPYPNESLADLPIHSRYDRFYVRAGELVENRIASHPLTEAQMYGGEVAGHGGVRNLPNEDLTRFGGPQGNDPISGFRDWGPGDSPRFPGSQIHITGGHHRTAEIVRRIGAGEMDPEMLIEFAIRT
jgi:RHS repeat-associated protein